jgi:hypothetical protein
MNYQNPEATLLPTLQTTFNLAIVVGLHAPDDAHEARGRR